MKIIVFFLYRIILEKFHQLTKKSTNYNDGKVIAGIVMTTQNGNVKTSKIIAIATGTKMINGLYINTNGSVINDSHAEIIARRCLVNYLYSELEILANNGTYI